MNSHFETLPIDAPLVTKPGILDHALANLLAAFTDCVLVPVSSGVNPDNAHVPLLDEADTSDFLSRLAINNIAVTLGPRSGGLVAIKFTDRAELAAFLNQNPASQHTLITNHSDGPTIWHKADTHRQLPLNLPGCTVQMTGNLQIIKRSDPRRSDVFLHRATPTSVNLKAVNWGADPDGHIAVWLAELSHGEFFRRSGRGHWIPITQTWRAYLAARLKPTTAYDTRERQFYADVNAGGWQPVTDHQMRDELRRLVLAAPVGNPESKSRITDEWLARLCVRLKSSLATHLPLVEGRLRVFVDQVLVKEPGANVTNAELAEAFANHCRQTGQPLLSANSAKVMLGRILRSEPWLVGYSKSIPRPAGDQNGWRGVRLRDQSIPPMTSDGAAGAPGAET